MTTDMRGSTVALALLAFICLHPGTGMAEEKLGPLVLETRPKLSAGQFIANCRTIGGRVTDAGSTAAGGRSVNCRKENGLDITCDFSPNRPTQCQGNGPRPQ